MVFDAKGTSSFLAHQMQYNLWLSTSL